MILQKSTDEQILAEFVKRFGCDGAILLYLDNGEESGLAKWINKEGKTWINNIFKEIKVSDNIKVNTL